MDWNLLKDFKKHLHLARNAVDFLPQTNISFNFKFETEIGTNCSLDLPPEKEISRFATILRPLAEQLSPLHFKKIALILINNKQGGLSDEEKEEILKHIKWVEDGPMHFTMNNEPFNASQLYDLYAKGEFFSENRTETRKILEYKKVPAVDQIILFNFYSYCCDVYRLCLHLYDLIRRAEARLTQSEIAKVIDKGSRQCIYCRSKENSFQSEEHVYPQSLGNNEIILPPGCVCDQCNNGILSKLDEHLINHDAISMLRVLYVPYNPKTGKFPIARYQDIAIEKTHPRKIFLNTYGNNSKSIKVSKAGNLDKIRLNMKGRTKFNPQLLGRSLYKIAMGLLCWQHGPDLALNSKYDLARNFILGKNTFPNNFIMGSKIKPCNHIEGEHYLMNPGTPFEFNIFGFPFLLNLEPEPVIKMTPELEKLKLKLFSLS